MKNTVFSSRDNLFSPVSSFNNLNLSILKKIDNFKAFCFNIVTFHHYMSHNELHSVLKIRT